MFDILKKLVQQGKKEFSSSINFIQFQTSQSSNQEEKQISDNVVKQMEEKCKEADKPRIKNNLLIIWVFMSFVSTLVMAMVVSAMIIVFWIFNTPFEQKLYFKQLNSSVERKLRQTVGPNLVQVIAQDNNSTSALMPCNSELVDELCHVYKVNNLYELNCEAGWTKFNYTDLIEVWSNNRCCGYTKVGKDLGENDIDSIEKIQGGKDFTGHQKGCGPCNDLYKARYR
jgi:hypothetical protein